MCVCVSVHVRTHPHITPSHRTESRAYAFEMFNPTITSLFLGCKDKCKCKTLQLLKYALMHCRFNSVLYVLRFENEPKHNIVVLSLCVHTY